MTSASARNLNGLGARVSNVWAARTTHWFVGVRGTLCLAVPRVEQQGMFSGQEPLFEPWQGMPPRTATGAGRAAGPSTDIGHTNPAPIIAMDAASAGINRATGLSLFARVIMGSCAPKRRARPAAFGPLYHAQRAGGANRRLQHAPVQPQPALSVCYLSNTASLGLFLGIANSLHGFGHRLHCLGDSFANVLFNFGLVRSGVRSRTLRRGFH